MNSSPTKASLIPRVNSCCCGCSLKTGTIIIGSYYLISCFLGVIAVGAILAVINHDEFYNKYQQETGVKLDERTFTVAKVLLGIFLVILMFGVILNLVMIAAAVKEKAKIILAWVVTQAVLFIFGTIVLISNTICGYSVYGSRGASIAPTIINILLTLYFLIVVYSYYKELLEKTAAGTTQDGVVYSVQNYGMPPAAYPNQAPPYMATNQPPPYPINNQPPTPLGVKETYS